MPSAVRQPELEGLLDYLKRSRGFDFTGYKRTTLSRRIQKRMQMVQIDSYLAYRSYLERNPAEFDDLFDTILINVTGFFRDEDTWDFLRTEVVPQILAEKPPTERLRVWSAGCATGEEAYSLAIVFAEVMGPEEFSERVKIYATDVDEPALVAARQATYAARDVEHLAAGIVEKYFEHADTRYVFRTDLRRSMVFGRNDLIQDAPISRIDLLACRNALMYFDAATQGRIASRFFSALNDGGYLLLGRAESLLTYANMFTPADLRRRLFRKAAPGSAGARPIAGTRAAAAGGAEDRPAALDVSDAALRAGNVAQLIVDRQGTLVLANDRANALFRLGIADVGRPLSDLDVSYRPADLRALIDQAYADRRVVVRGAVAWRPPGTGEMHWFDVQVTPLHGEDGGYVGTSVAFSDVTAQRRLQVELEQSEDELHAAHEELQSTNEKLQTMNDELRVQGEELEKLNRFLEQVFTSLGHGVAVVDSDLRVLVWNRKAEDLWGVRADEIRGAHFLGADIGLPVEQLRQPIRTALATGQASVHEALLPASNRRGRPMQCRVVCAPLVGRDGTDPRGAIVIMEEVGTAD